MLDDNLSGSTIDATEPHFAVDKNMTMSAYTSLFLNQEGDYPFDQKNETVLGMDSQNYFENVNNSNMKESWEHISDDTESYMHYVMEGKEHAGRDNRKMSTGSRASIDTMVTEQFDLYFCRTVSDLDDDLDESGENDLADVGRGQRHSANNEKDFSDEGLIVDQNCNKVIQGHLDTNIESDRSQGQKNGSQGQNVTRNAMTESDSTSNGEQGQEVTDQGQCHATVDKSQDDKLISNPVQGLEQMGNNNEIPTAAKRRRKFSRQHQRPIIEHKSDTDTQHSDADITYLHVLTNENSHITDNSETSQQLKSHSPTLPNNPNPMVLNIDKKDSQSTEVDGDMIEQLSKDREIPFGTYTQANQNVSASDGTDDVCVFKTDLANQNGLFSHVISQNQSDVSNNNAAEKVDNAEYGLSFGYENGKKETLDSPTKQEAQHSFEMEEVSAKFRPVKKKFCFSSASHLF